MSRRSYGEIAYAAHCAAYFGPNDYAIPWCALYQEDKVEWEKIAATLLKAYKEQEGDQDVA